MNHNPLEKQIAERPDLAAQVAKVKGAVDQTALQKLFEGFMGTFVDAWILMAVSYETSIARGWRLEMPDRVRSLLDDVCRGFLLADLPASPAVSNYLLDKSRSLPLSDQKRIAANHPIKLVLPADHNDHEMVEPSKMTRAQIDQMSGPRGIRSVDEQIAWFKEKEDATRRTPPDTPWVIQRRPRACVTFREATTCTPADLRKILRELTGGE